MPENGVQDHKKSEGWGTQSEMLFISKLGCHAFSRESRIDLLEGYLEGAYRREKWGSMNPSAVIAYAEEQLREEITGVCEAAQ